MARIAPSTSTINQHHQVAGTSSSAKQQRQPIQATLSNRLLHAAAAGFKFSPAAFLVALALSEKWDNFGQGCFVGKAKLVKRTGLSMSSVKRGLRELRDAGVIARELGVGETNGHRHSTARTVLAPDGAAAPKAKGKAKAVENPSSVREFPANKGARSEPRVGPKLTPPLGPDLTPPLGPDLTPRSFLVDSSAVDPSALTVSENTGAGAAGASPEPPGRPPSPAAPKLALDADDLRRARAELDKRWVNRAVTDAEYDAQKAALYAELA